jgi:hypothetical protein
MRLNSICLVVASVACFTINMAAQSGANCSVLHTNDIETIPPTCNGITLPIPVIGEHRYSGQCETLDQNGAPFSLGDADRSPTTLSGRGYCPFSPPRFNINTSFLGNPTEQQWMVQNYKLVKSFTFDVGMVVPDNVAFSSVLSCPATTCNVQCPAPAPNQSCSCDATNGNWVCPCQGTPVCGDGSQAVCQQGEWFCSGDDCTKTKQPNNTCSCLGTGTPWVCQCAGAPLSCSAGQQSVCYPPSWTCTDPHCIGNAPGCNFCPLPVPNDSCACDTSNASWRCECQGSPGTCSDGSPQTCINGGWTCGTVTTCAGTPPNDTCTCGSNNNWQCSCQGSPGTCADQTVQVCVNGSWTCGSVCAGNPPCQEGEDAECVDGNWQCILSCQAGDPSCTPPPDPGDGGGGGGGGGDPGCGCDPFEDPTCNLDSVDMAKAESGDCSLDSADLSVSADLVSSRSVLPRQKPTAVRRQRKSVSKGFSSSRSGGTSMQ